MTGFRDFSDPQEVRTGPWAHPPSYVIGTGGGARSPGVKLSEHAADKLPPSNVKDKKV